MYFEQFTTAARAAVAGLEIVLLPKFLVENQLESEELVLVINQPMKSDYGYFLVTPSTNSDYAPVAAFCEWLLQQAVSLPLLAEPR